jgi:glutamate N-acetyltransferase / amino-acid N-acetyltransferase
VIALPAGFGAHVANVGIKDDTDDFVVIASTGGSPVAAAGVFTRSRFVGPSVTISRRNIADGHAAGIVVVSKNANVANGPAGDADAAALVEAVAARLGCDPGDVLVASTGVIGRRYPMDRVLAGVAAMPAVFTESDLARAARGMMTTDTVEKVAAATVGSGPARVVGMAKGVGMIEPDMATMIAVLLTDASVPPADLDAVLRRVVERTFNCVSIDTDTSTSDTVVVLASGMAGAVGLSDLESALGAVAESLTRQIAGDGEGATTLIEVLVDGARDRAQAKRVAKAIVNSPLVKTAVHGADPNWGRVAMAIGKCQDDTDIDQERVVIRFGDREVYPTRVDDAARAKLSEYLRGDEVRIHVSLGTGTEACTVWGCDLTAGYVRINADYTT